MAEISDRILCMGPNIQSGEDANRPLIKANCQNFQPLVSFKISSFVNC